MPVCRIYLFSDVLEPWQLLKHMVVGRASPVPASSFGFWLLRLRLRLTPPTCSFSDPPNSTLLTEFGAEQFLVNLCLTVWNHYAGPQLPKGVVHVDLFQRQWKVHVLIAWRFRVLNDKNIFLIDQQLEIIFDSGVNRCRLDEIFVRQALPALPHIFQKLVLVMDVAKSSFAPVPLGRLVVRNLWMALKLPVQGAEVGATHATGAFQLLDEKLAPCGL